ncbi:MAG: hypothetical protein OXF04_05590, partial [bacterium]|nr:hypothetical protein [bacterium]
MQKSVHRLLALLGLVLAFSLIAASCGNDDDDGATPAEAPEATAASTEAPDAPDAPEPEETVTVVPVQDGGTLEAVMDRGYVMCGSRDDVPGFALLNADGEY